MRHTVNVSYLLFFLAALVCRPWMTIAAAQELPKTVVFVYVDNAFDKAKTDALKQKLYECREIEITETTLTPAPGCYEQIASFQNSENLKQNGAAAYVVACLYPEKKSFRCSQVFGPKTPDSCKDSEHFAWTMTGRYETSGYSNGSFGQDFPFDENNVTTLENICNSVRLGTKSVSELNPAPPIKFVMEFTRPRLSDYEGMSQEEIERESGLFVGCMGTLLTVGREHRALSTDASAPRVHMDCVMEPAGKLEVSMHVIATNVRTGKVIDQRSFPYHFDPPNNMGPDKISKDLIRDWIDEIAKKSTQ